MLTFASKPNFEAPAGTNAAGNDNEYKVVVQASDGATMNTLNWFKVTVNVKDVEEEGSIKLQPTGQTWLLTLLQPQVGVAHYRPQPDR